MIKKKMGKNRKTVSVNDVITYATCPLKYKLLKERDGELPAIDLFAKATLQAIKVYFMKISLGQSYSKALTAATKRYVEVWTAVPYSDSIRTTAETYYRNGTLLSTHIHNIYDPKTDEVAAVSYPIDLKIGKKLLVTDSVDLILIHREKVPRSAPRVIYRIIQLHNDVDIFSGGSHANYNERYVHMRAALCRAGLQKDLGQTNKRRYSYEIRPLIGKTRIVTPLTRYTPTLHRVVEDVAKAIDQDLMHATTSKETCRTCAFKSTCKLSLIRT